MPQAQEVGDIDIGTGDACIIAVWLQYSYY